MIPRSRANHNTELHGFCEFAQSKCMSTCHKKHQHNHLMGKFAGKMLRPRLNTERGHTLCVSLRGRNACPHAIKTSEKPLRTEIYWENAAAQIEHRMRTHTLCEPALSGAMSTCHTGDQKNDRKMLRPRLSPERGHTPCASLRNQNARPHVTRNITRATLFKMPQNKLSREHRQTLCASLRSRNAYQDFTRITWHANLQAKCRGPQ